MSRPILLLSIAGGLILLFLVVRHWSTERVVERRQAALIAALERRSEKHLDRLLASNYEDQWGFDRDEVKLAVKDIGSQFIILTLIPEDPSTTIADGIAEVTTRFDFKGTDSSFERDESVITVISESLWIAEISSATSGGGATREPVGSNKSENSLSPARAASRC